MGILYETLDGKQLEIVELKIVNDKCKLNMYMWFVCEESLYNAIFYNVSRINITDFSAPMQIGGLEIVSNAGLGWESSSRYMFHDFEESTLNFYFEEYEIIK